MQVNRTDAATAPIVKGPKKQASAPDPQQTSTPAATDRFKGGTAPVVSEGDRLAQLKAAVEAARADQSTPGQDVPPLPEGPLDPRVAKARERFDQVVHDTSVVLNPGYVEVTGMEQAKQAREASEKKGKPYKPPGVVRPPYTGGAPALDASEMDATLVNNNPELKLLYAIESKAPWALKGYQLFTKVLGPAGAVFNLGYSAFNAKRILSDPKAPGFLKGGIVASTAMAGASAAAAVRVGLHAWHIWPMAAKGAALAGKVAGVAGLGAGAVLSAMDTFNTFRDPKATPAQKGISLVGTLASVAMPITILMGIGGPIGIGLGLLAIGLPFLKGPLGKIPFLNHACSAIGKAVAPVGHAIASAASGVKHFFGHLF